MNILTCVILHAPKEDKWTLCDGPLTTHTNEGVNGLQITLFTKGPDPTNMSIDPLFWPRLITRSSPVHTHIPNYCCEMYKSIIYYKKYLY